MSWDGRVFVVVGVPVRWAGIIDQYGVYLHQYESGSYLTQTITVSSKDEGIVFNLKPVTVGGTVTAQMSLGGVVLYEETFTGQGHGWETVVVPLRYVLEMRELYGLDVFGLYEVRFTVPSGPDDGAHVFFDEITLATISYHPPQPSE